MSSFSADVRNWTEKAKKAPERVFKTAIQYFTDSMLLSVQMGGDMPVLTGNLRRSLMASTSAMPAVRAGQVEFPESAQQVALTIAGMKNSETLYLGFQADYATRMEYGFVGVDALGRKYNQAGHRFVGNNVDRWQNFVDKAAKFIGE